MCIYLISVRKHEEYGYKNPVTYASWLAFALPLSAVCLTVAWFWLTGTHLGFRQVTNRLFVFFFHVSAPCLQYGCVLVRGWSKLIAFFLVGSPSWPAKAITVARTEQAQKRGWRSSSKKSTSSLGLWGLCFQRAKYTQNIQSARRRRISIYLHSLLFSFAEISNIAFFFVLITLWLTRDPGLFKGWGSLFPQGWVLKLCDL